MHRNDDMYHFLLTLLNFIFTIPLVTPLILIGVVLVFFSFAAGLSHD